MWRISFQSINNANCRIDIYNGTGDDGSQVTYLQPATSPFEIDVDDDNDIFTPIRLSSGNVKFLVGYIDSDGRYQDNTDLIRDIFTTDPLSRPVVVYMNGIIRWRGFLKGDAPEYGIFSVGEEISMPIISSLSVLESTNVVLADSYDKRKSVGQILYDAFNSAGITYRNIYFPTKDNPAELMQKKVDMLAFISQRNASDYEVKNGKLIYYDGDTQLSVIENLCTYMGWMAVEAEDELMFIDPLESPSTLSFCGMDGLLNPDNAFTIMPCNTYDFCTLPFYTTEHQASIVSGKRSIEYTGKAQKLSGIFEINDAKEMGEYYGNYSEIRFLVSGNAYESVERRIHPTPLIEVNNNESQLPIREGGAIYNSQQFPDLKGSFFEAEGIINNVLSNMSPTSYVVYDYDGDITPCIIFIGKNTIHTAVIHPPFASSRNNWLTLVEMQWEYRSKADERWSTPSTSQYVNAHIQDGEEIKYENSNGKITLLLHNYDGQPIYVRTTSNNHKYLKVSNISVKYYEKDYETLGLPRLNVKDTIVKEHIGNGFKEDYSLESILNSKIPNCVSYFDANEDNEHVRANIIKNYYSASKKRYHVTVKSQYLLNPAHCYSFNGNNYRIVSQQLNCADATNIIKLQEI